MSLALASEVKSLALEVKPLVLILLALCVGNANPGGIFQTRVYRFDGLQTWVPGFDYVSPAGGQ